MELCEAVDINLPWVILDMLTRWGPRDNSW